MRQRGYLTLFLFVTLHVTCSVFGCIRKLRTQRFDCQEGAQEYTKITFANFVALRRWCFRKYGHWGRSPPRTEWFRWAKPRNTKKKCLPLFPQKNVSDIIFSDNYFFVFSQNHMKHTQKMSSTSVQNIFFCSDFKDLFFVYVSDDSKEKKLSQFYFSFSQNLLKHISNQSRAKSEQK